MKIILIFTFFYTLLISCNKQNVHYYYDVDIEKMVSIAKNEDQLFCCVLIDSLSDEMKLFYDFLKTDEQIRKKALFNFIDITDSSNFWYIQWLRPVSNTVTCVFNPSGKLLNLINGVTYESFIALKQSIINNDNKHFYPNRWNMAKDTILPFMNEVLQCKINYEKGEDIQERINNSLSLLKYPFNLGLKFMNELRMEKLEDIKYTCRELLLYKDEENILDFFDLFLKAENVVNKKYTKASGPYLEIFSDTTIYNCLLYNVYKVELILKNKGEFPLNIFDVITGCGCLKYIGEKECQLLPNETMSLTFNFEPDVIGLIERSVYIVSDAVNKNLYKTHFYFNVKQSY